MLPFATSADPKVITEWRYPDVRGLDYPFSYCFQVMALLPDNTEIHNISRSHARHKDDLVVPPGHTFAVGSGRFNGYTR
jgi:hypothetical protein